MIEIKQDGPFGYPKNESQPARLRIIGLGQTGVNALDKIVMHGHETHDIWVIDTDQQALDGSVVKEKILLGSDLTHGMGCGGDAEQAEEVAAASESQLSYAVSGCDYVIITLGLGGGTGTALAPDLVRLAQKEKAKVIVLATLPFSFEGRRRQAQAQETLKELRSRADAVLVFANDRLVGLVPETPNVRHSFHLLNQVMAQAIETLAQILCKRALIQLTFADVRSLFARYTGIEALENCWAGAHEVQTGEGPEALVHGLMNGPFFTNAVWEEADHALISLTGGHDLSLAEVQEVLGKLQQQFPPHFTIATGANLDENSEGTLRLTMLLAKTKMPANAGKTRVKVAPQPATRKKINEKPAAPAVEELALEEEAAPAPPADAMEALMGDPAPLAKAGKSGRARKHLAKQEELPFEASHRGRFEKSLETIYRGENLDQPTFRRRKLQIRL
jgi:cell division protein FtsZ